MKGQNMQRMEVADATIAMAASAVGRTHDLIETGWVQGALLKGGKSETQVEKFCIQGALMLALNEQFGEDGHCGRVYVCAGNDATQRGFSDIEALATAFIVQEAAEHFQYDQDAWKAGRLGGAEFNDAADRTHEQVLRVLKGAEQKLWSLLTDEPAQRSWADVPNEELQESVMMSVLA